MSNYNRNLRRFNTGQPDYSTGFNAVQTGMRLMAGNEGGLFGQFGIDPSQYEVKSGDTFSEIAKSQNVGLGELMRLNPNIEDYNVINPGDALNLGGGKEGEGLLGSVQALDKVLGGYGKKALGKAGSFAMDKLGGEAIKNFGSKMLAETGLSSLAGSAGAVMGALGPIGSAIGIAQAGKELVDATVDQYEGLESGIAAGETMQTDLSSRATEAKTNLFSKNKDLSKMMEDRKGKLSGAVGAQAEKVLSATDTMAGKTGLETSSNPYKKTQEGLIQSYLDSGDALQKQMENIKLSNIEGYKAQKAGLIAEGQDLQASIDDMQSQKDDMEWQYKTAKAVKFW